MSQGRCANVQLGTVLRWVGGACGCVVTAIALWQLIVDTFGIEDTKTVIALIYCVILGLMVVIAELRVEGVLRWFAFMSRPVGLGLFYCFVGGLALSNHWYDIVIGCVMFGVGLLYILCGLCCQQPGLPTREVPPAEVPKK